MNRAVPKIELPPYISGLLNRLNGASHAAFAVGGAVRDSLLGRAPSDWDVTTSAKPEEVRALFPDCPVLETGLAHGTLTLLLEEGSVEVTTFRAEGAYSDRRRPDSVTFLQDPKEDLARRDFTVNAMALGPDGTFLDPFGGREDLEQNIIRCVGDPVARFSEDPLRILRGLRFASKLGFAIEEKTRAAMKKQKELLKTVSLPRIGSEFGQLLCGPHAQEVLADCGDVLVPVLPEILPMFSCEQANPYHDKNVWFHTLAVVDAIDCDLVLRLAAFFHDIGKPFCKTTDQKGCDHFHGHPQKSAEIAEDVLRRLSFDHLTVEKVTHLVRWHDLRCDGSDRSTGKLLFRVGPDAFENWLALRRADTMGQGPRFRAVSLQNLDQVGKKAAELLAAERCFTLNKLAINGRDLQQIGFAEGKELGALLQRLLKEVAEGLCVNDRQQLLNRAQELRTLQR